MRNRMDCFGELLSRIYFGVRARSRCCNVFDGLDYVESYEAPAVLELLDELRLGKHQGLDYALQSQHHDGILT